MATKRELLESIMVGAARLDRAEFVEEFKDTEDEIVKVLQEIDSRLWEIVDAYEEGQL